MSGVYVFGVYDTYFAKYNSFFGNRSNVSEVSSELQYPGFRAGASGPKGLRRMSDSYDCSKYL